MSRKHIYLLIGLLLATTATGVHAVTLTAGPDADTYVIGGDDTPNGDAAYLYMQDTADGVIYIRFDLAALNILSVEDATLTMYVSGGAPRNDNLIADRFWLHGLDNVPGNTPQDWDEATLSVGNVGGEYGDPLVKPTDLWGYFKVPPPLYTNPPNPLKRRDKIKGITSVQNMSRATVRAITPSGFAQCFCKANR